MKAAIIISGKDKNIFLTPENDDERMALSFLSAGDLFEILSTSGDFYSGYGRIKKLELQVARCQAGWLRGFAHKDSLVLGVVANDET